MLRKLFALAAIALPLLATSCGSNTQPTSSGPAAEIEVTRLVEVAEEVEVTRIVEVEVPVEIEVTREVEVEVPVEVEVTRQVEVIVTPTATPLPETAPGTFEEPYVFGEGAFITFNGDFAFTMTVTEVLRGPDALQRIKAANSFNEDPPEGYEFIVALVSVDYNGEDIGILELSRFDVGVVTNGRIIGAGDFITASPCCLTPEFDITLLPGGTAEGYVAYPIVQDDPNPLLLLGEAVYFSLTPAE